MYYLEINLFLKFFINKFNFSSIIFINKYFKYNIILVIFKIIIFNYKIEYFKCLNIIINFLNFSSKFYKKIFYFYV